MKTFKSIPDVERLRDHPLRATIKSLVSSIVADYPDYRPEDDGYLVLIEPDDVDRVLDDLDMPWRLSDEPFALGSKHEASYKKLLLPSPSALSPSTKIQKNNIESLPILSYNRGGTKPRA